MKREALQKAIDNLSIQMVYLYSSEVQTYNEFDPLIPNQELICQFHIHPKSCRKKELPSDKGVTHKFLVYQTETKMRYFKGFTEEDLKRTSDNKELPEELVVSEIIAVFTAEYEVRCDEDLPHDAVVEFGKRNVPHHIWPYWREYAHATCGRMSLPVSMLPMLSINKL